MPNTDLIDVLTEYAEAHKRLRDCMNMLRNVTMNPAQRSAFNQMCSQEDIHQLLIDSFTKPGTMPWYWSIGENPAASGSLGMVLPEGFQFRSEEDEEEDTQHD